MSFFYNEVLNNKSSNSIIQHPDLDDENRIVKRNSGKNTPIRLLKQPNNDFFFSKNDSNFELLRLRFNDKNTTISNKPVRSTVYLKFKKKIYNQRTNIGKKNNYILW